MAKQGFSYYKAETDRFQDIKIKRLKKRYHCTGYAVYQYVLNEIYRVRGYFLQFTEDHLFDVSEYWDIEEGQVTDIIGYCAEIGLFNAQLWQEKGVLTGRSIQTRYIDICKVCKKAPVIEEDIRLVAAEQAVSAPPPLPSLFPGEEFPAMRIVSGRMAAEAEGGSEGTASLPAASPASPSCPAVASLPASPSLQEETPQRTAVAVAEETPPQGIGAAVLADLEAAEARDVSEGFQKFPETSGKTPEESDKSIKSYTSETNPSSDSPREEADKASLSRNRKRLRLLLQSVGCIDQDWRWICTIEGIEAEASPVWQLVNELKASGGRHTFGGYVMPSLRSLVAAGRLRIRPQTVDMAAELRRLLQEVKVPSYDIEKVLKAAAGLEPVLREAIAEVRRSKGKITMPGKYLMAQLRKATPAEAS